MYRCYHLRVTPNGAIVSKLIHSSYTRSIRIRKGTEMKIQHESNVGSAGEMGSETDGSTTPKLTGGSFARDNNSRATITISQ